MSVLKAKAPGAIWPSTMPKLIPVYYADFYAELRSTLQGLTRFMSLDELFDDDRWDDEDLIGDAVVTAKQFAEITALLVANPEFVRGKDCVVMHSNPNIGLRIEGHCNRAGIPNVYKLRFANDIAYEEGEDSPAIMPKPVNRSWPKRRPRKLHSKYTGFYNAVRAVLGSFTCHIPLVNIDVDWVEVDSGAWTKALMLLRASDKFFNVANCVLLNGTHIGLEYDFMAGSLVHRIRFHDDLPRESADSDDDEPATAEVKKPPEWTADFMAVIGENGSSINAVDLEDGEIVTPRGWSAIRNRFIQNGGYNVSNVSVTNRKGRICVKDDAYCGIEFVYKGNAPLRNSPVVISWFNEKPLKARESSGYFLNVVKAELPDTTMDALRAGITVRDIVWMNLRHALNKDPEVIHEYGNVHACGVHIGDCSHFMMVATTIPSYCLYYAPVTHGSQDILVRLMKADDIPDYMDLELMMESDVIYPGPWTVPFVSVLNRNPALLPVSVFTEYGYDVKTLDWIRTVERFSKDNRFTVKELTFKNLREQRLMIYLNNDVNYGLLAITERSGSGTRAYFRFYNPATLNHIRDVYADLVKNWRLPFLKAVWSEVEEQGILLNLPIGVPLEVNEITWNSFVAALKKSLPATRHEVQGKLEFGFHSDYGQRGLMATKYDAGNKFVLAWFDKEAEAEQAIAWQEPFKKVAFESLGIDLRKLKIGDTLPLSNHDVQKLSTALMLQATCTKTGGDGDDDYNLLFDPNLERGLAVKYNDGNFLLAWYDEIGNDQPAVEERPVPGWTKKFTRPLVKLYADINTDLLVESGVPLNADAWDKIRETFAQSLEFEVDDQAGTISAPPDVQRGLRYTPGPVGVGGILTLFNENAKPIAVEPMTIDQHVERARATNSGYTVPNGKMVTTLASSPTVIGSIAELKAHVRQHGWTLIPAPELFAGLQGRGSDELLNIFNAVVYEYGPTQVGAVYVNANVAKLFCKVCEVHGFKVETLERKEVDSVAHQLGLTGDTMKFIGTHPGGVHGIGIFKMDKMQGERIIAITSRC